MISRPEHQKNQFDSRSIRQVLVWSGVDRWHGIPLPWRKPRSRNPLACFVCTAGVGRPENPVATPNGELDLELDTAGSGRWSQADKRDRIVLTILRLYRDRRTGRQIRHGVIPQQDRSVKSGGQVVNPNSTRRASTRPLPSMKSPSKPTTRPIKTVPSSSSTFTRSGFSRQKRRACGLQHNIADGR